MVFVCCLGGWAGRFDFVVCLFGVCVTVDLLVVVCLFVGLGLGLCFGWGGLLICCWLMVWCIVYFKL